MHKNLILSTLVVVTLALGAIFVPTSSAVSTDYYVDDDLVECPTADFTTIADAVVAASDGDRILLCDGTYTGVVLDKSLTIKPKNDNHVALINDGPLHPAGLVQGFHLIPGSEGSTLNKMNFENVDLAVYSRDPIDNVTVSFNKMNSPIQGITNWHGSNWTIRYNEIDGLRTSCGGGIGIFVGAFNGVNSANNNLVAHNLVEGTLQVSAVDCGGYSGTGIVLFSDHRFGRAGGPVEDNTVRVNKVDMVSDNPGLVDVVGFEMTDSRDDLTQRDIVDNFVKSNQLNKTTTPLTLTPSNLDEFNTLVNN